MESAGPVGSGAGWVSPYPLEPGQTRRYTSVDTGGRGGRAERREISGSTTGIVLRYLRRVAGDDAVDECVRLAGDTRPIDEIESVDSWSSYDQAVALLEAARTITGDPSVARRIGEEMLRQYMGTEVAALLRSLGSPGALIENIASTVAKFSTVTQMEAVEVTEHHGVVDANTVSVVRHPLFCDYTIGLLSQATVLFGMEPASVRELRCQTRGDDRCRYEIDWTPGAPADPERRIASLEAQLAALTARFEALQATAADLVRIEDVETALEVITDRAGLAVRAPGFVLAVQLPGEAKPRVHSKGLDRPEAERMATSILEGGGEVEDKCKLVVDVVSARARYGRLAALHPTGAPFLPQERRLLETYAAQAAAALDTATALELVKRQNHTARDLLRLSASLAEVVDTDEVAERVAHAARAIIDSDQAAVLVWDDVRQRLFVRGTAGLDPQVTELVRSVPIGINDSPTLVRLFETHEPIAIDHRTDDPIALALLALGEAEGVVAMPIAARGRFFGVVCAAMRAGGEPLRLTPDVIERLEGLAGQAATALDNAHLLDRLRHDALHDALIELPNRILLNDRVRTALETSKRTGKPVGFLFFDLDEFKSVNDSFGHLVGDAVIAETASRVRGALRSSDTIARMSGDEFAVLLPQVVDLADVEVVARKILDDLRVPMLCGNRTVHVTASIGAVVSASTDDYDDLVSRADEAMYRAKALGRNTIVSLAAHEPVRVDG